MATMNSIEDRKAELARQLAELDAEQGLPIEGTDIDGDGGVYLTIGDEQFECRRVSTSYQMMKFAKAQREAQVHIPSGLPKESEKYKALTAKRNAAGMAMMATMLETITILLKPHERERFDTYMTDVSMGEGLEPNALENAIGEVIAAVGGEQGKAGQNTASPSSDSSETTNVNVVDYSFSKGGVQAEVADKQPANVVKAKPATRKRDNS